MRDDLKPAPPVPEEQLRQMLSDLLAESDSATGALNEDSFWRFVAAVGQGRGITERLHAEGLKAADHVPTSPRVSFERRKQTSYHAGTLLHLLLGMGRVAQEQPDPAKRDGASLLPGNFNTGVVVSDLLAMQEGHPLAKPGRGQLLVPPKGGEESIRMHARRMLVGAVLYRAARFGLSKAKVRDTLDPYLEKPTWDSWQREFGGPKGEFAKSVAAQAEHGGPSMFDVPDERLTHLLQIALSGPGRGADYSIR